MLYNILKDQWQTIEIDRIRSITQETEFSQMAELLYDRVEAELSNNPKVATLNICWSRAIDGHWHAIFWGL